MNWLSLKCQAEACWMAASEMASNGAESSGSINDITNVQNLKGKDSSLSNTDFVIYGIFMNIIPCNNP